MFNEVVMLVPENITDSAAVKYPGPITAGEEIMFFLDMF